MLQIIVPESLAACQELFDLSKMNGSPYEMPDQHPNWIPMPFWPIECSSLIYVAFALRMQTNYAKIGPQRFIFHLE